MAVTYQNLLNTIIKYPVANPAALSAIDISAALDGVLATVVSLGKVFQLHKTSTETPDGVGVIAANGGGNWIQVKGRVFNNVASEAAMIALPATEGDMAFRTDTTQAYVKNNGTSNTIADWNLLRTNSDEQIIEITGDTTLSSTQDGALIVAKLTADSIVTFPSDATSFIDKGGFFNFINDSVFFLRFALESPDTTPLFLPVIPPGGSVKVSKTAKTEVSPGVFSSQWTPTFYSSYYRPQMNVSLPYTPDSTSIQQNIVITGVTSGNPGILTLAGPPPGILEGVGTGIKNALNKVVKIKMVPGLFINNQTEYDLLPQQELYLAWDAMANFRILNEFLDTSNLMPNVDATGSTLVTLNATHHGKSISVGNSGNGAIDLPQNSTEYLPVGYWVDVIAQGIADFAFVPSGSDVVLNPQALTYKNKMRIRKVSIDNTGLISTWLISDCDTSFLVPNPTVYIPIAGTITFSAMDNKKCFGLGAAGTIINLPVPASGSIPVYNAIWDGVEGEVKNMSSGDITLHAITGTTIEGVTDFVVHANEAVKFRVINGAYKIVSDFIPAGAPTPVSVITDVYIGSTTQTLTNADLGKAYCSNGLGLDILLNAMNTYDPNFYFFVHGTPDSPLQVDANSPDTIEGFGGLTFTSNQNTMVFADNAGNWRLSSTKTIDFPSVPIGVYTGDRRDSGIVLDVATGSGNVTMPVIGNVPDTTINPGFSCYLMNSGAGTPNFVPDASNPVTGLSALPIYPGQAYQLHASDAGSDHWNAFSIGGQLKEVFYGAETNTSPSFGHVRARSLAFGVSFNFNFMVPADFYHLVAFEIGFFSDAGAFSSSPANFGVKSSYGNLGSAIDSFSTTVAGGINLNPVQNKVVKFSDISAAVPSIGANQFGGIEITQSSIGGTTFYFVGIRIRYTTRR